MEPRFGHDFSPVRVHADAESAQMNRELKAQAFTHKQNVFFAAGKYEPGSSKGKHLLAHELTHTLQQGSATSGENPLMKASDLSDSDIIQRNDAAFESGSGIDSALTSGTMAADSIMGTTITAGNCRGLFGCNVGFLFSKAYKGTYPYRAAGRDVKGVYVKIESVYDHGVCGSCDQIRLIQTVRNITRGRGGNIESADPGNPTRRERSGWGDTNAPSRGWRVDQLTSGANRTNPFYDTDPGFDTQIGTPSQAAILWDAPGNWDTDTNVGKEFQTFLVCETTGSNRKTIAGVNWGYYTDGSGNINFRPTTPNAACGPTQELQDAVTRWEGISGNQAANIDFTAESPVDHEGTRSMLWFERDSTNLRNDSDINSDIHYGIAIRRIRQHILATMPYTQIIIHGYSSTDGNSGYNMRLSERRAVAIRDRLMSEGIPAHMLNIEAHGENSDLSPSDLNRRVEIETTHFVGPLPPPGPLGP
jgi:outer membrane protein OmpA-like peptidoglycan-associated protein